MATNKLTPIYFDYGGNPVYGVGPIYHKRDQNIPDRYFDGPDDVSTEWYECPNCGEELELDASHDVYTEGYAPQATPDQYRCMNCDYTYAE